MLCPTGSYQDISDGGWEAPAGGGGEGGNDEKYSAFTEIVLKYIMDGAPDEVNLRYERRIARLHSDDCLFMTFFRYALVSATYFHHYSAKQPCWTQSRLVSEPLQRVELNMCYNCHIPETPW